MFLPFFIAILLGLATPTNTNNNCGHSGGTITTADDTGGETGQNPPPKIN